MHEQQKPKPGSFLSTGSAKQDAWWMNFYQCKEKFPCLSGPLREWFLFNVRRDAFGNLHEDQKASLMPIKNRFHSDFFGKLPGSSSPWLRSKKARVASADFRFKAEMKKIGNVEVSSYGYAIAYWARLLEDYGAFKCSHDSHKPSQVSENSDERRLAQGYNYCLRLANNGKMPLEIEILYVSINPCFAPTEVWKQKLADCTRIFCETGNAPSIYDKRQGHLANWYNAATRLNKSGNLPKDPPWLSSVFPLVSQLHQYAVLSRAIGEENIVPNPMIADFGKWAEWRNDVKALRANGGLSPDALHHFNAFSDILKD